jgi:hypothetical protein
VRKGLIIAALALGLVAAADPAEDRRKDETPVPVTVDDFQGDPAEDGMPAGWEKLTFEGIPRHTDYRVVEENGSAWLEARADRSASGLVKRLAVDLATHPVLAWRWRIDGTLPKGDARSKDADDYAARLYVSFRYDPGRVGILTRAKYALARRKYGEYPPLHTLNYIWANKLEQGTFIPNAYSERAMMVAVRSGDEKAGQWVAERRNVYEDYVRAFGEEPTPITYVAIMTDTDNTRSAARAAYDDIRFEPPAEERGRRSAGR